LLFTPLSEVFAFCSINSQVPEIPADSAEFLNLLVIIGKNGQVVADFSTTANAVLGTNVA
jgi:hypothetical protein